MRAELTIEHSGGNLVAALVGILGPHNPNAVAGSLLAQKSPASATAITYSAYGPGLVVMAWPTPGQLFLYVESSGGRLRRAAADVWDIVRNGGVLLRPNLKSLVLLDEDANDEIVTASVGLAANLGRRELLYPILLGVATLAWLAIALAAFNATGDLVLGAIPAVLAALLATVVLVSDSHNKTLAWK